MNNLPLITTLPEHTASWGKGDLSLIIPKSQPDQAALFAQQQEVEAGNIKPKTVTITEAGRGHGLEILDLGNCSLSASALPIFTKNPWNHLRSITLHSNPLTTESPNYVELLQQSPGMSRLQIIDNKRVVEKKKKEVESKSERKAREIKERKMRPSGANMGGTGKMREWGGAGSSGTAGTADIVDGDVKGEGAYKDKIKSDKPKDGKKRRRDEDGITSSKSEEGSKEVRKSKKVKTTEDTEIKIKRSKTSEVPKTSTAKPIVPPQPDQSLEAKRQADPSALTPGQTKGKKPSKTETSVVGVIDVVNADAVAKAKKEGSKRKHGDERKKGGVDLKAMLSKPQEQEEGTGLGVGGW